MPTDREAELGQRLGLGAGPVFLSVGGIEARKNTIAHPRGFRRDTSRPPRRAPRHCRGREPARSSRLSGCFRPRTDRARGRSTAVSLLGPVADADMPGLYRLASALVFASVNEGFGLCVLEAMASGTPVVVSRIAPFVDYLDPSDALWCDPADSSSIAGAMRQSLRPDVANSLRARGPVVAARFGWRGSRRAHLPVYRRLRETVHA